jgi:2-oxoacid:acceptor oxidoreductase delta subunit (pyruvate/2-ketoisovalerate family)
MAKIDALHPWKEVPIGCAMLKAGNSRELRTGDWRSKIRPATDKEKCIKCGMCWIFCPDMAYSQNTDGYFDWNTYYCKGCGICARECPKKAIQMIAEEE